MARPGLTAAAILDGMDQKPAPRFERRRLSHVDRTGRPRMVDVSAKPVTARRAVAEATVSLSPETMSLVIDGGGAKGDVLGVAELAGVMGAKRTSELIPLCHPLALTDLQVSITPDRGAGVLRIRAEAATTGQTGVEMEAMTAASVAALTVYDMVKGVERGVEIGSVHLVSKTGGKSGEWIRPAGPDVPPPGPPARGPLGGPDQPELARPAEVVRQAEVAEPAAARRMRRALVLTVSDGVSAGVREDESGAALQDAAHGHRVRGGPRARAGRRRGHRRCARGRRRGPRPDRHDRRHRPHAARRDAAGDRAGHRLRGARAGRGHAGAGRAITPLADLSRGLVGVIGRTLVVNVPGSPKGAIESFAAVEPVLDHALETLAGPFDHGRAG